jgi:hypothetical protein
VSRLWGNVRLLSPDGRDRKGGNSCISLTGLDQRREGAHFQSYRFLGCHNPHHQSPSPSFFYLRAKRLLSPGLPNPTTFLSTAFLASPLRCPSSPKTTHDHTPVPHQYSLTSSPSITSQGLSTVLPQQPSLSPYNW